MLYYFTTIEACEPNELLYIISVQVGTHVFTEINTFFSGTERRKPPRVYDVNILYHVNAGILHNAA